MPIVRSRQISYLLLLAATSGIFGCAKSSESAKTAELQPHAITNQTPAAAASSRLSAAALASQTKPAAAPPTKDQVVQAVARVFDRAVTLDESHGPAFVVGDFNGDGSEDLAVITKSDERWLPEINNELANWTLEDPKTVPIPGTTSAEQLTPPKPAKAKRDNFLLAIIHGVGAEGWRNREARQTFLLVDGVGTNISVLPASKTAIVSKDKLGPLKGDAITETLDGHSGIIFWTGAKYSWWSPNEPSR